MTIDPKAAELAKALADAVAAQQTEEYQELYAAAKRKEKIDVAAQEAAEALEAHFMPRVSGFVGHPRPAPEPGFCTLGIDASIFGSPSDPAHYDLPRDEDEFSDPKPNGALSD